VFEFRQENRALHFYLSFCLDFLVVTPNYLQETHWDHPEFTKLMTSLLEMNVIKYSAYRLAMKLRSIQRRLQLDLLDIEVAHRGFEEHGLTADRHEVRLIPSHVGRYLNPCLVFFYT